MNKFFGKTSITYEPMVLLWERAVSSSLGQFAPLCVCIVFLFGTRFGFHWLRAFMFVMFCVNTQLMSLLISSGFLSRFGTWLVNLFAGHVLVFLFCVSTWLLS